MKKVLLGTTALVAAGLAMQQAQAANPIKMSVGGFEYWGFYYAHNPDDNPGTATLPAEPGFNKRDNNVVTDTRIDFKGSTVLDNGLEVGALVQLRGTSNSGDQIDRSYSWVKGSYGTLRIGNDKSAAYNMSTAAPYVNYFFGANSPSAFGNGLSQFFGQSATPAAASRSRFAAGGWATFTTFPDNSRNGQLEYFSPVFNGFQFGASYAPGGGKVNNNAEYLLPTRMTQGTTTSPAFAGHGPVYTAAARYDGNFGGMSLTGELGYAKTTNKAATVSTSGVAGLPALKSKDWNSWNGGVVVGWNNFSVGGSYLHSNNMHNVSGTDSRQYDLGVRYNSTGPWSVGVAWLHSKYDYAAGNLVAGSVTDKANIYRLQGNYALGPGINATGVVGYDTFKDGVVGSTYHTTMVGGALLLDF